MSNVTRRFYRACLAGMLTVALAAAVSAWAVPPETINIHGMLLDASGDPLPGARAYVVRFFDAETGGTQLGGDLAGMVEVSPEGLFNLPVLLPPEALAAAELWYELGIDTDMPPDGDAEGDIFPGRIRVHSVPFALEAGTVVQIDADRIGDGTVDNTTFSRLAGVTQPIQAALDEKADNAALSGHVSDDQNPHGVTKAQVGLGDVDNTSDMNKPISTATQDALDLKENTGHNHSAADITSGVFDAARIPTSIARMADVWQMGGNAGTSPSTQFLGTTDNIALELRVNNARAMGIVPGDASPNLIGGFSANSVTTGVVGATIGGGGAGDNENRVTDNYGVIGGGYNNQAGNDAGTIADRPYATVGGGDSNTASGSNATVGGGRDNTASDWAATVGGGAWNTASGYNAMVGGGDSNTASAFAGTVGGGSFNTASGDFATVGGGENNNASAEAATVGGGILNTASGYASVGGGILNTASDYIATVGGGGENTASAFAGTVGGGAGNAASADYATVGGGGENTASAEAGTVGGGAGNAASADYATVGGGRNNDVQAPYGTIAGGGPSDVTNPTTTNNRVTGNYGAIGGGGGNQAGNDDGNPVTAAYTTVGGGYGNTASGEAATVGGGWGNTASKSAATVGGGVENTAAGDLATVAGGYANTATGEGATVGGGMENIASVSYSTVGGGVGNTATGQFSTVPGGIDNTAQGTYSFAAGRGAKANHAGAFVWGDSTNEDVTSSTTNEFTARASGGVRFFTNSGLKAGVKLEPGGGSWSSVSDRNVKENFAPVDGVEVLERVAALPISTWNYKSQDASIRHIGPMAQDVYAAFGLGESDTTITAIDADGIALAAIQGLNQRLEQRLSEKDREIAALRTDKDRVIAALRADKDREIAALRQELEAIKVMINPSSGK